MSDDLSTASGDDESTPAIRCIDDVDCDLQATVIEIRCGQINAKLHMRQFVCPGIHQPCIEYDNVMITPKQFTIQANKDKQKDWKGSIRIGKSNLRALMEMKSIDFYQHDSYCSGKCQSRNYIAMNKALEETNDDDHLISTTHDASPSSSSTAVGHILQHNFHSQLAFGIKSERSNKCGDSNHQKRRYASSNGSIASAAAHLFDNNNIKKLMIAQPAQFWANMYHLGIIDDLIGDMAQAIGQIKPLYAIRPDLRHCLADKLTSIVCQLDLAETISERIYAKRMQTLIESNHLTSELQELQRKADEQRKKHDDARRKAELFERLFTASTSSSASSSNNDITSSSPSPSVDSIDPTATAPSAKCARIE